MRFVRDNGLALFFGLIFLLTLVAQSVVGHTVFNDEQLAHGEEAISYGRYLVSSHFGEAVLENWESEWLQMGLFALAGIYLFQRGSVESKQPEEAGFESDQKEKIGGFAQQNSPRLAKLGDWRTGIYSHSLTIALASIFFLSWLVQSLTGWTEFNNDQTEHNESPVSWLRYLTLPDFWEKTLQNWQSEFLALGTMTVLTIYLRQRGSPESKPVGSPHTETGRSH